MAKKGAEKPHYSKQKNGRKQEVREGENSFFFSAVVRKTIKAESSDPAELFFASSVMRDKTKSASWEHFGLFIRIEIISELPHSSFQRPQISGNGTLNAGNEVQQLAALSMGNNNKNNNKSNGCPKGNKRFPPSFHHHQP